jgi:sterol-4alpha-carboxylate 3-dehydrogenase (decarboxylating)
VIKNNQTKFQIGSNQNLFDWTYVGNVAHAHLLAADKLDTTYPVAGLHEPLPEVNLSLGEYRIPTSAAHPLGPKVDPTPADLAIAAKFDSKTVDPTDLRPVLRSKMDQFCDLADSDADEVAGQTVAGQAFFINNCEPVNFWDWTRAVWRKLGHTPPYTIVLPVALGLLLATLAELFSKLSGREPGFTRFRVTFATQQRYYDSERARRLLGYTPIVGITEGLDRWTSWYQDELNKPEVSAAETPKNK